MRRRLGWAGYAVGCLTVMGTVTWWLPAWLHDPAAMLMGLASVAGAGWIMLRLDPEPGPIPVGEPSGSMSVMGVALDPAGVPVPGPAEARSWVVWSAALAGVAGVIVPGVSAWPVVRALTGEFVPDDESGPLWWITLVGAIGTVMFFGYALRLSRFAFRLRRAALRIGDGGAPRLHARVLRVDGSTIDVVPVDRPEGEVLVLDGVFWGLRGVGAGDEVVVDGPVTPGAVAAVTSGSRRAWLRVGGKARRSV